MDLFDVIETLEEERIFEGEKKGRERKTEEQYKDGFKFGYQQGLHIKAERKKVEGFFTSFLDNVSRKDLNNQEEILKIIVLVKDDKYWQTDISDEIESKLKFVHLKVKLILKKLNVSCRILENGEKYDF